jgi:hypothetical protein
MSIVGRSRFYGALLAVIVGLTWAHPITASAADQALVDDPLLLTDGLAPPENPANPPTGLLRAAASSSAKDPIVGHENHSHTGIHDCSEEEEGDPIASATDEGDPTASYIECQQVDPAFKPKKPWKAKLCKPFCYPGTSPPIYCVNKCPCCRIPIKGKLCCLGLLCSPCKVQITVSKCCNPNCKTWKNVCVGKCCSFSTCCIRVPWCGKGKIIITPIKKCGMLCTCKCKIITIPINVK